MKPSTHNTANTLTCTGHTYGRQNIERRYGLQAANFIIATGKEKNSLAGLAARFRTPVAHLNFHRADVSIEAINPSKPGRLLDQEPGVNRLDQPSKPSAPRGHAASNVELTFPSQEVQAGPIECAFRHALWQADASSVLVQSVHISFLIR